MDRITNSKQPVFKKKSRQLDLKQINRNLEMYQPQKKSITRNTQPLFTEDLAIGKCKREKTNAPSIFIAKTYKILENDYSDIVVWNKEGTYFTILDVERFEQEILPVYFRHRNFSSFVRQLNMYDFHKIRNQQNKSIFEHREFRRGAKQLLKNIKRKGCPSKKVSDPISEMSQQPETPFENYEDTYEKNETQRHTEAAIQKESQVHIQRQMQNPIKNQLLQDFIASLPDIVNSEQQVRQIIKEMKKDSRYRCLDSKEDVRKVVHKIRHSKMRRQTQDDLQQLSIQEQIMVGNVDQREPRLPTLAVVSSDNYLPLKTQNLICSLILCDDIALPKQN